MAPGKSSKDRSRRKIIEDDDEETEIRRGSTMTLEDDDDSDEGEVEAMFSSQAPELSQEILPAKPNEQQNLIKMDEKAREQAIRNLTRLVLFKALAGEPIDRAKCIKEAGISGSNRIASAAFEQANIRLRNQFDFELRRIPKWTERLKNLPAKYKDRYFVVNILEERAATGQHSKTLHSVHESSSIEKGLLMVILALAYCKGDPRNDGSRWILDKDLYSLLNRLDENIPSEPPAVGGFKRKSQTQSTHRFEGGDGVSATPNVDVLLARFCHLDYLLKETASDDHINTIPNCDEGSIFYSMGPRSFVEVGRKQVIFFCAEILEEEPDPTMLMELKGDLNGDEEDMKIDGDAAEAVQ